MEPTQQPEDDGLIRFQRLTPDQFDVVLGSHPSKAKIVRPPASRSYKLMFVYLALFAVGVYALTLQLHKRRSETEITAAQPTPVVESEPAPAEAVVEPVEPTDTSTAPRIVLPVIPAPAPSAAPPTPAQGMVSASYMAAFKAENTRADAQRRGQPFEVTTASLREWDGRNHYQAQWRVVSNHIEERSVCANFPGGSIENRECRKAAQVYFKESCTDWTKRANRDHDENGKTMMQRYCEAAQGFDPAG